MMESMVVGDSQKNAAGGRRLSSIDGNETNFSCASYRRFNSLDEMPTLADICDRYDSSSHPGVASSDFVKRTPNACSRPRSRSLAGAPAPASSLGDNPSSPVGSSSLVRGMLPALGGSAGPILASDRYKTELCRSFAETGGNCRYGDRCQFAHGPAELRSVDRHPRYKTELCRTFHSRGFCAYGPRCHFIHNIDETRVLPSNVLEQMIAQRQLADMLLIAQIAATSSSSPEILQPQSPSPVSFTSPLNASAATAAIHRRYSLDNYSASVTSAASDSANGCAPSYFRRVDASTATPSAPSSDGVSPSWSSHRNVLSQLSSSYAAAAAAASEAELFRARSMSLGSAASRSIDGCSGTSSPGPSSPTSFGGLTIAGLRNGGAPMTVQSAIAAFTADCRGWLDSSSSSPSSSPSVPDSPTSNVGLPDAWSPFNPWCRGSSGSRRNYTDSFDVRGEKFGVTAAGHTNGLAAGCVGAPGRIPMWPIS